MARPVKTRTLFRNVRVFDGERVIEQATVEVADGRIHRVARKPFAYSEPHTRLVKGEGLTLLPGLIDAHAHTWFEWLLEEALAWGVTTVIDMATPLEVATAMREQQARSRVLRRADLVSAGQAATAPGGHGSYHPDRALPVISSVAEAEEFVRLRVDVERSDFLKVILEPGIGRRTPIPAIDKATLRALIAAAKVRNKLAVVHALSSDLALTAVRAGASGLAHSIIEGAPRRALLDEAGRRKVFVIPTLAALRGALGLSPDLPAKASKVASAGARFEIACRFVRLAARVPGIDILAGSDCPNPGVPHGEGLHRELELLASGDCGGMTPIEALRSATSLPADRFGLMDRGRIRPGARADLLLIRGDPTRDIGEIRGIAGVWKWGSRRSRKR